MKRIYILPILFIVSLFSQSFVRLIPENDNTDSSVDNDTISIQEESFVNDSILAIEDSLAAYADSVISALYPRIEPITHDVSRIEPVVPTRSFSPTTDIVNSMVPDTIAIDTSKPVGEIPILSSVSPTGGKTYEIPIEITPGMNGLQPNISLSYNSLQGNSLVGMGWSISGLSRIERAGQSIYYDGQTKGVEMKNTDAFILDGVRLIRLSQQSDHILYESEMGHIKVKGYFSGNVMKYFEVFYPDGRKGVFGESSNSENRARYPIMSLSDLWGNSISFSYLSPYTSSDILTITYNGGSLYFTYDSSRPDRVEQFIGGVDVTEPYRLSSITVYSPSGAIRTYNLTYTETNNISYLTELGCSSGSSSLNPLRFYYGVGSTGYNYDISSTTLNSYYPANCDTNIKTVLGQVDYENNADGLIVLPSLLPYYQNYTTSNKSFENKYTGTETIYLYTGLDDSFGCYNNSLSTGSGFVDILCADLEGKQQEYIIKINNSVASNQDQITFKVYQSSYSGQLVLLYTRTYSFSTVYTYNGRKSVQPKSYYAGDFNGDGKMEILAVSTHQPFGDTTKPSICYIFDLINNQVLYQGHIFDYCQQFLGTQQTDPNAAENNSDKLLIIDYDGDGKNDLCHINTSGTDIYTFNVTGNTYTPQLVNSYNLLNRTYLANTKYGTGDFNGDGKTDFLVSPAYSPSNYWYIHKSKGNGDFSPSSFQGPAYNNSSDVSLIIHDVNGDGHSDMLYCNAEGADTYLCNKNSFDYPTTFTFFNPDSVRMVPLIMTSRNSFTQLIGLKDNTLFKYKFQRDERKQQLMTGMANSLGIIEKNEYLFQIGDESSVLTPAQNVQYTPTFPYITLHEPMTLLYRSEKYMKGVKFDKDTYAYGDAVCHRQGLGFRGFTLFTRDDYQNRAYRQTFDVEQFCLPLRDITPAAQTDYTYSVTVESNKIAHARMTEKDEYNPMNGVTAYTAYTYYFNDYPSSETTTYSGSGISIEKQYSYDSNTTVGDGYYLGYPYSVTTTISDNAETYTEWEYTTHDRLKPLTRNKAINSSYIRQESFTYDNNGNRLTETVYPYSSSNALLTTYTYNGNGQIASKTDPLGVTTSYTYDNFGRIGSISDTNGDDDQYIYDAFGHLLVHNHNSNLSIDTCTYAWSMGAPNSLYRITRHQTGKPHTISYYDALNREVRTSDKRFNGNYRHIDRTYNSHGLLAAVSLPFKGTSATYWNNYYYDYYDRITAFAEASGHATTYSYNGLSKTTTEDGITTTRTYDVLGRLISSTDPAGTITYALAPDGQPNSITTPGNVTTTFIYNSKRQRTSMDDPSAGTTEYEYDAAGNIYKVTDARGKIALYYYDLTGRLEEIWHPEFTVNRSYNSRNQLTSVTSTNGVSKQMTYDGNGRISSWTETVDSVWLQKDYTYSNNNLASISYTSHRGFIASEHYGYANGTVTTISKNGSLPVFQLTQENELGMPTGVTTLNLTRTYSYNSTGIPTGRTASGPSNTIQDESYSFNAATSNLLSRTDNIRNLTDQFTYDNLNRISSYHGASAQYDAKGNITSKSDVGTFSYNNSLKPYAVTGTSAASGTISTNTQDITYNTFPRARQIAEGAFTLDFTYDGDLDRVKEEVTQGNSLIETRYTLGGCYDYITGSMASQKQENLYLAGGYGKAPILVQRYNDGSSYISHLVRDYQGSIMSQVDSTGFWHNDWSYDAWGRPRNPQTHVVYNPSILNSYSSGYRGYCGHEHLPQFGLINMNARLYDPITSRFLAPDPYIQMSDNTQGFNRYSYCLNNPTKYTDPSGELLLELFISHYKRMWLFGGIKGLFNGDSFWKSANRHVANDFKINIGLFTLDGNKNFGQKVWEAISRQTWQLPQSALGFVVAHGYNVIGDVRNVRHKYGVTVLSTTNLTGTEAVTIGNYITGSEKIEPDANNETFQHEYGHYIQSQKYGWAYLSAIGLPSLKSASQHNNHRCQPYEVDANRRSDEYLTKNVATYTGWKSYSHPLPSQTTPGFVNDNWYDYILGSPAMPIILSTVFSSTIGLY